MLIAIKSSIKIKKFITFISEFYYLVADICKLIIALIGNLIKYRVFFKEDLVIVTASDKYFYESFMQLIESISIYEKNTEIIFYDLGLNESQKEHLKSQYKNVKYRIFEFSQYPDFFKERDEHEKLGGYAWKSAIVWEILKEKKGNVLWLDAGNKINRKLYFLRIVLTFTGFYSPLSNGTLEEWTYSSVLDKFNVQDKVRRKRNLTGGIVGFNYENLNSRNTAERWFNESTKKEIITPVGSSRDNHRQDQSLLSIIIYNSEKMFYPMFKTKKLFSIKVNQNPGKRVYLSESYGNSKALRFRSEWYKKNNDISTNTIKASHYIWIITPDYWRKIPKKYLQEKIVIVQFFHDYKLNKEKFEKDFAAFGKKVNYFFVESEQLFSYLRSQNIPNLIQISSRDDLFNYRKILNELIEKSKL